jgi:uncharacterized membrane protein YgcG
MHLSLRSLLPAVLLCGLVAAGPAWAVYPPPVKDEGKFFSKDTLEKADKKVREIYDLFHKDVVVETYPAIPANLEAKYKELGRKKFFIDWANSRMRELGVNGIYMLITKEPGHLRIEIDDRTKKEFTPTNRDQLVAKMLAKFKEKKFDDGLLEGLDSIEKAMKSNTGK